MKLQGDYALRPDDEEGAVYFECPGCHDYLKWLPCVASITTTGHCGNCGQHFTLTKRDYAINNRYEVRYDLEATG